MIQFASPEWFPLVPLLLIAGWKWRRLLRQRPLRLACLALLVLLLTGPEVRRLQSGLDLWVLVDQSSSAEDSLHPNLREWEALLQRSRGADDRILYVDYADESILRGEDETLAFSGNRERTRTASAIRFALNRMASDRASRLLVLSDGYSTEPLAGLGEPLAGQRVPLDFRLAGAPGATDYRVVNVEAPNRVQPSEPFLLELTVAGRPNATVPFRLYLNGKPAGSGSVEVADGRGAARIAERTGTPGAHRYEIELLPEDDAYPGNNYGETWVEVAGGPRILLVSGYEDDPAGEVLSQQGFAVDLETDPSSLNPGRLSGARAVIINNVPADAVPGEFLQSLDFFVREQGGGFLMAGGRHSFGAGGYHGSVVEDLLPVSTELREDHRRLSTAMAIVMDRSGSMNAVLPGAGGRNKMQLANRGAAKTIELLGATDAVTVFAVDTRAHQIIPLTTLEGGGREQAVNAVGRISSQGGGIFVYTGLGAAWEELQKAEQGQRHVILFADAMDAEEPGDYRSLLETMTADGVTLSVIGLGTEEDADADFLKDVANRGNGRYFFSSDPAELPAIFMQETVAVARSTFIEEPAALRETAAWSEISPGRLDWVEAVDGYNLTYLREQSAASAFAADEYNAPLVAQTRRGPGRTAAVTFPLGGDYSARVREWPAYGDFIQTLARWLMGEDTPRGISLRTRVEGEILTVDLLYDERWQEPLAQTAPLLHLAGPGGEETLSIPWERLEPGRFRASHRLRPSEWVRGAAQVGQHALSFGPVVTGISPEWAFDRTRITELRNLAHLSGGEERLDLSNIWQAPRQPAFRDSRAWLVLLLLALFLLEALQTRLGGRLRPAGESMKTRSRTDGPASVPVRPRRPKPSRPPATRAEPEPPTPPREETELRRKRFTLAKRRGR